LSVFGDAQVVAGLRYEKSIIHNRYWVRQWNEAGDEVLGAFDSNRSAYSKLLPSIALTYRPGDRSVYRASLWTSYTRPPFFQLGGSATQTYDPATRVTSITRGNPDLKAIDAINFDVSGGWTFDQHGYLNIGAYYKHLSNYIYGSGSNYVNTERGQISRVIVNQPRNGGDGDLFGVEFEGQQKLGALNPVLDGFSIGGNLTLQHSEVDIGAEWGRHQRMQNAPNVTGNIGVFYADDRFTLDLLYRYTSDFLQKYDLFSTGSSWSDVWVRPTRRVDLHAGYRLGAVDLDLSIANLTGTHSYWSHVGRNSSAISDIVQSGRTALLTAKYSF
jgi:TonB-dependent receptor